MIYTPLTNKAMRIAYKAHQGQVDNSGQPYVFIRIIWPNKWKMKFRFVLLCFMM